MTYENGLDRVKERMVEAHEGNLAYARKLDGEIAVGLADECRDILARLEAEKEDLGPFGGAAREGNLLQEIAAAMEEFGLKGSF